MSNHLNMRTNIQIRKAIFSSKKKERKKEKIEMFNKPFKKGDVLNTETFFLNNEDNFLFKEFCNFFLRKKKNNFRNNVIFVWIKQFSSI